MLGHIGADGRIVVPGRRRDLVAANMEIGVGKQARHLLEQPPNEGVGLGFGRVHRRPEHRDPVVRIEGAGRQFGIGGHDRAGVRRQVDLRHDTHAARRRIGHQVAHLILGVILAVAGDRGQAGIEQALDAEALVVAEMQVKHVQLDPFHGVDLTLQRLQRHEVARRVDHQAAPRETWRILDLDIGQDRPLAATFHQLTQGGQAPQHPVGTVGGQAHALRINGQTIGFGGAEPVRLGVGPGHYDQGRSRSPGRCFAQTRQSVDVALKTGRRRLQTRVLIAVEPNRERRLKAKPLVRPRRAGLPHFARQGHQPRRIGPGRAGRYAGQQDNAQCRACPAPPPKVPIRHRHLRPNQFQTNLRSRLDWIANWFRSGTVHLQSTLSILLQKPTIAPLPTPDIRQIGGMGRSGPLYLRLERAVRAAVNEDRLAPGAALPSERTLCDAYDLSRVTVRKALDGLVARRGSDSPSRIGHLCRRRCTAARAGRKELRRPVLLFRRHDFARPNARQPLAGSQRRRGHARRGPGSWPVARLGRLSLPSCAAGGQSADGA